MAKKQSRAAKVRKLLSEGVSPKEIAKKLNMNVQTVYNIRYQANKKQGVGALSEKIPTNSWGATGGIASAPRRRGRPPKQVIVVPPSKGELNRRDAQAYASAKQTDQLTDDTKVWGVVLVAVVVLAIGIAILL
jgi:transposase-like protein